MIPTWEQMHAAILQQMDESEKTVGIRKTTQGALAKAFNTNQCAISLAIRGKFKNAFENIGLVCTKGGGGFHGGIYEKDFAVAKSMEIGPRNKYFPRNTESSAPTKSDSVLSLIDRLDAPVEKKSIETLLAEQIRLQLDRNAQFADRIFQIAMGA